MAEGGGLDDDERRRLQTFEDQVDQGYGPFHEKCGKGVFFSEQKLIATSSLDYGVVFSAKPIPLGGTFQVKLLQKEKGGCLVSAQSNMPHILYV